MYQSYNSLAWSLQEESLSFKKQAFTLDFSIRLDLHYYYYQWGIYIPTYPTYIYILPVRLHLYTTSGTTSEVYIYYIYNILPVGYPIPTYIYILPVRYIYPNLSQPTFIYSYIYYQWGHISQRTFIYYQWGIYIPTNIIYPTLHIYTHPNLHIYIHTGYLLLYTAPHKRRPILSRTTNSLTFEVGRVVAMATYGNCPSWCLPRTRPWLWRTSWGARSEVWSSESTARMWMPRCRVWCRPVKVSPRYCLSQDPGS